MMGSLHGIRVSILFLVCLATNAFADAPVTSYDCAPGTPVKGVGCSCPKMHSDGKPYAAKRAADDEGKAICQPGARPNTGPGPARAPSGGYDKLLGEANDAADAFNCAKAEELYQKALAINAKGIEALVGSGNCMAKQSKWTNAHMRFDKALSINAKFEPALWGKAEAYRLAFKKDDAVAAYRQYLDVFPNAYKAKQALEKLQGGAPSVRPPDPVPSVKPVRNPTRTQDVNVTVTGTRIVANGVEISGTPQVTDFQSIYGKPDRVWDTKGGVNRVHTWDKLGFVIYEPLDGRAVSATFPFKAMGMAYDPSTMFGGSIAVDGLTLNASTDLADVKGRPGATQPYSATSVVFSKGDFNVFMTSKLGPLELVEISMWKKGKTPASVPTGGDGKYTNTKDVKVVISGSAVSLNGVSISGKPYLKDIEAIYGKPDRVWDTGGANRIHTYDKLGIVVYEPRDGRAVSTTFPYRAMGSTFDPSTLFGGSITVDGRSMPSTIDIATLKARPGAGQPYGADSIVFDKGDIHVFTIAKAGAKSIDLVEISYWQLDKKPASVPVPAENPGIAGKATEIKVEVASAGTVTLNGKDLGGKPMLADFKKALGEPSRVWDKKGGANRIHTWDDLGLVVYEPYNGRAVSLTMPYKAMTPPDFSPKTLFSGRVSLDGRGFYKFNTISTIKSRKGATQPYGEDSVMFDFGDIHVFVKAPAATTQTIDLVEVSFWQKKK